MMDGVVRLFKAEGAPARWSSRGGWLSYVTVLCAVKSESRLVVRGGVCLRGSFLRFEAERGRLI